MPPDLSRRRNRPRSLPFRDGGGRRPGNSGPAHRHPERRGDGHDRLRPPHGPARRFARPGRRLPAKLRRRQAVHPEVAGEIHRHRRRVHAEDRPGMGRERGEERRPEHDHRGGRHQPLVPQRPDLPGRHHLPPPDGKRRAQRGGPRPLCRPGKGGASRAVDLHRHGPGLGEAAPASRTPRASGTSIPTSGGTIGASSTTSSRKPAKRCRFTPRT